MSNRISITDARHAVGNAHDAVTDHQRRATAGLASRIEQLTRWATRDTQQIHIQETVAER